jgi:type I restriction enzyme S subunit
MRSCSTGPLCFRADAAIGSDLCGAEAGDRSDFGDDWGAGRVSVPAYPAYKNSRAVWLGEIPAHWEARPIRYFATSIGGGTPNRENPDFWNGYIPWVSPKDMKTETIHGSEEAITVAGLQGSATSMVDPGAVLLVVRSGILKHTLPVAINAVPVALNQDMKALRPNPRVCLPDYLARVIQGNNEIFLHLWAKQGATVESIEQEYLNSTVFPLPPLVEQSAIIAFLDRETGKIDALVAEQERLMALLKEKRQAVISHAVTKGLDPDVPMKDSGVEWLGEVPAHWGLCRVKHIVTHVVDCLHTTPTYDGEPQYPAIRTADVERGRLLLSQARLVSEEVYKERIQRLRPVCRDVLYSREGERFGLAALVPENVDLCLGQRMIMFRAAEKYLPEFLMWVLNSDFVYQQVLSRLIGASAPHVNIADIINFTIPFPAIEEQRKISDHINEFCNQNESLLSEAARAITLLKERRAALISAAVTGKIDVRPRIPKPAEAA